MAEHRSGQALRLRSGQAPRLRSGQALPTVDDPFGIWEAAPAKVASAEPSADVSFAVQPVEAEPPVQRVVLPAALDAAWAVLEQRRRALQRGAEKLDEAERRMARVGQVQREELTAAPERELCDSLDRAGAMPSFALEQEDAEQRGIRQEWEAFVARLRHIVSHPVRAQTQVGGALVGYTTVDLTGDFETTWRSGVTWESKKLHRQTLHLILAKRAARLRLLVVVSTGATRLALQLSGPGTQVLALPTAWKFVRDVLNELRQTV